MRVPFRTTRFSALLMVWMAVSASAPQSVAIDPTAGPALWQVGDDDTTIYLYGLPNLMDADTEWRTAAFDAALSQADAVILEADRSSPAAQAAMQQTAQRVGIYQDGRTLSGIMDDAMRAQARSVAESLSVPLQALNPLRPWLAANQLQTVAMQQAGLTNPQTPTAVITAEAGATGTPIDYLEDPTTLLAAMGGLPDESQVRMFQQALDILQDDPGQARRILSQWATGDVDGLAATLHGEGEWPDETVRSVMLLERNAAWHARLEEILATETGVYFVAVGVGHVVGEDSLVAALEAAGHEVARQ